ncbi:hypothetical protein [Weissella confusa]|uniref:hypothetical protein n=1 Tax=Weissella confusa TaxID=1583 RepID=UPI00107F2B55|nr:hypothetical protein [Weissella confusa]MBJ7656479.1 hypothetical protein [Weissella confusa]TGE44923.1 hypothetical protein C6P25_01300 [Weissella confusa]
MFPQDMQAAGYAYSDASKFANEFGNFIEMREHESNDSTASSRKRSNKTIKAVPGISTMMFPKFLLHNTIDVKLLDVWTNPVEYVNVPTILVDMDMELESRYDKLVDEIEDKLNELPTHSPVRGLYHLAEINGGITFLDMPDTYDKVQTTVGRLKQTLVKLPVIDEMNLTPKEQKLVDIATTERSQDCPMIVYVKDTGSTNEKLDVRKRLTKVLHRSGFKVASLDASIDGDDRTPWL